MKEADYIAVRNLTHIEAAEHCIRKLLSDDTVSLVVRDEILKALAHWRYEYSTRFAGSEAKE